MLSPAEGYPSIYGRLSIICAAEAYQPTLWCRGINIYLIYDNIICLWCVGLIRLVEKHHAQMIYTRATKAGAAADE